MGWGELRGQRPVRPILAKDLMRFKKEQHNVMRNAAVALVAVVVCLVALTGHMSMSVPVKQRLVARPPARKPADTKFEFELPSNVRPGSIMHVLVPGYGKLAQEVLVPKTAVPGDMLAIDLPAKASDRGKSKQILQESKQESEADEIEGEVDEIVVEAEFTAQQFWLLIIFVLGGTVVIMVALRGIFQGFGALEVDTRRVVDHPCRHTDAHVARLVADAIDARNCGEYVSPATTPRTGRPTSVNTARADTPKSPTKTSATNVESARSAGSAKLGKEAPHDRKPTVTGARGNYASAAPSGIAALEAQGEGLMAMNANEYVEMSDVNMAAFDTPRWELWTGATLEDVGQRLRTLVPMLIFQALGHSMLTGVIEQASQYPAVTANLVMVIGLGANAATVAAAKACAEISKRPQPVLSLEGFFKTVWGRQLGVAITTAGMIGVFAMFSLQFMTVGVWASTALVVSCMVVSFVGTLLGALFPYVFNLFGDPGHSSLALVVGSMEYVSLAVVTVVAGWTMISLKPNYAHVGM